MFPTGHQRGPDPTVITSWWLPEGDPGCDVPRLSHVLPPGPAGMSGMGVGEPMSEGGSGLRRKFVGPLPSGEQSTGKPRVTY